MNYKDTNFSYGFEIEGVFTLKLIKSLEKYGDGFRLRSDGSVRWNSIIDKYDLGEEIRNLTDDGNEEVNLGIFKSQKELLKALKLFEDGKNYFQNESCGLHLHVYPLLQPAREIFWGYKFIKRIQNFAYSELCECVKKRKTNTYCKPYTTFKNTLNEYQRQEKYAFVRNHPQKTLEFRFLAPCEHKVENVKKFLEFMRQEMTKKTNKVQTHIFLKELPDLEKDFDYSVGSGEKTYKINYSIN